MSYVRCNYAGCPNIKRRSEKRFYKFPKNDPPRLAKWIAATGNPRLLEFIPEQLMEMSICENHFEESCFVNESHQRLRNSAVPNHFQAELVDRIEDSAVPVQKKTATSPAQFRKTPVKTPSPKFLNFPTRTYERGKSVSKRLDYSPPKKSPRKASEKSCDQSQDPLLSLLLESPSRSIPQSSAKDTPRKAKLRKDLKRAKEDLRKVRQKGRRLTTKFQSVEAKHKAALSEFLQPLNANVKTFFKMQIHHKKRTRWTQPEKILAMKIYYKSPACYKFLRKNLKFSLPGVSTIQSWLGVTSLRPGLDSDMKQKIQIRASVMTEREKKCVLLFDEMALKKHLSYNSKMDMVEGFEDLGQTLGRTAKPAKNALVFMARGLYDYWKIPFSYYLSSTAVSSKDLAQLIKENIAFLHESGLDVKAIVCDQGSSNRKAQKILGATRDAPSFDFLSKKIFAVYDAPHLIKSVRNALLKRKDFFVAGKQVLWDDVIRTYEINKTSRLSDALKKITDKHMRPNHFEKMNVSLATQVFSKTFYAVMKTCIASKELKSRTANNTADFLFKMNDIFDHLNSRTKFSPNPAKCALSHAVKMDETIKSAVDYVKTWSVPKNRPFCFDGLIQTMNAIVALWNEEKDTVDYLLTNRLNQDPIENLFSKVRQRRGFDPYPSVEHFRLSLQTIISASLEKSTDNANCENDEDDFMFQNIEDISAPTAQGLASSSTIDQPLASSSSSSSLLSSASSAELTGLELCSVNYFAGYATRRTILKFKCDLCKKNLIHTDRILDDEKEILILNRDYSKESDKIEFLFRPKEETYNVAKAALTIYDKIVAKKLQRHDIKKYILQKAENIEAIAEWVNSTNSECSPHRRFFLNILIVTKLHSLRKSISKQTKTSGGPPRKQPRLQ